MSAPSNPEAASLELARRLLTHLAFGAEVELMLGGLPPSLADQLPLPAGARLLGSLLRSLEGRLSTLETVFDATGDPSAVLAAYQRQLEGLGWEVFDEGPRPPHGGFMSRRSGEGVMLRWGGSGPVLRVAAAPTSRDVDLRVTLDWEMPRHLGESRAHRLPSQGLMPTLYPPDGVTVGPRGGSGGGGHWEQRAVAYTGRPPAELEAEFAGQLVAAGWTRDGGRADDTVAWSWWKLPGDQGWTGLLLVLAFSSERRSLWLVIESAESDETSGGWTASQVTRG